MSSSGGPRSPSPHVLPKHHAFPLNHFIRRNGTRFLLPTLPPPPHFSLPPSLPPPPSTLPTPPTDRPGRSTPTAHFPPIPSIRRNRTSSPPSFPPSSSPSLPPSLPPSPPPYFNHPPTDRPGTSTPTALSLQNPSIRRERTLPSFLHSFLPSFLPPSLPPPYFNPHTGGPGTSTPSARKSTSPAGPWVRFYVFWPRRSQRGYRYVRKNV